MTEDATRPFRAVVVLDYDSEPQARVVADALGVEAAAPLPKAAGAVTRDGSTVTLVIRAGDASALRAAANSFLRWALVAEAAHRAASREE